MRKLLLATAIATLAVAPALAQQGLAPAPVNPYAGPQTQMRYGAQYNAYAPSYMAGPFAAQPFDGQPGFAPSAPVAVSIDGRYLGADPDPFIRQSLMRDQEQILGSGPN